MRKPRRDEADLGGIWQVTEWGYMSVVGTRASVIEARASIVEARASVVVVNSTIRYSHNCRAYNKQKIIMNENNVSQESSVGRALDSNAGSWI